MPVWWGIFAYMMIVSMFGMAVYKKQVQNATHEPVDDSSSVNYKSIGLFFALATFALLVYYVGQRSFIFDSTDYQYSYEHYFVGDLGEITEILKGTRQEKGPLFKILLIIFKHITHGTYNDWFTFVAIIQCTSIAVFLYKYSINFSYSVFFFFTTSTFLWLVNGIRQFLAVAVVLFFVDWIKNKKTIPFILVIVIAYLIHSSALLWLPVYFIIRYKPWSIKFITLSVIITTALYFFSRSSMVEDTDYAYLTNSSYQGGVNPVRVIVMAVPSIIAFTQRKIVNEIDDPFVDMWVNLSVITTECYIVGMFTSGIMGRLPSYFQMFNLLLLPWLLKKTFEKSLGKTILVASLIGYFAYFLYDMYISGNGIYQSISLSLTYLK